MVIFCMFSVYMFLADVSLHVCINTAEWVPGKTYLHHLCVVRDIQCCSLTWCSQYMHGHTDLQYTLSTVIYTIQIWHISATQFWSHMKHSQHNNKIKFHCVNVFLENKLHSIKVRLTALTWPTTFILTYDLQFPVSYGYVLLTCKSSRSVVRR